MLAKHFIPSHFMSSTVNVVLVGCGGTGSRVLPGLAQIDYALRNAYGHPGLAVTAFDGDTVSESNVGRQLFYPADVGKNKADVIVNRVNMCYGLDWRSVPLLLNRKNVTAIVQGRYPALHDDGVFSHSTDKVVADILITAVDSVPARKEISGGSYLRSRFWLDTGNAAKGGQVILGTLSPGPVPRDSKGELLAPDAVDFLPTVLDLYPNMEEAGAKEYQGPSCSMATALKRQDLFVNQWVALAANELLWDVLRHPFITSHGRIINLATGSMRSLPVDPEMWTRMAAGPTAEKFKKAVSLIKRRVTLAEKKKAAAPADAAANSELKEAA